MYKFKQLKVWQRGIDFTVKIYKLTVSFPSHKQFGMINQMRKCACSIPYNTSEGAGRRTDKEFARFLDIALGSANELGTQLIIANRLEYIPDENLPKYESKIHEVQNMLIGLTSKLL